MLEETSLAYGAYSFVLELCGVGIWSGAEGQKAPDALDSAIWTKVAMILDTRGWIFEGEVPCFVKGVLFGIMSVGLSSASESTDTRDRAFVTSKRMPAALTGTRSSARAGRQKPTFEQSSDYNALKTKSEPRFELGVNDGALPLSPMTSPPIKRNLALYGSGFGHVEQQVEPMFDYDMMPGRFEFLGDYMFD